MTDRTEPSSVGLLRARRFWIWFGVILVLALIFLFIFGFGRVKAVYELYWSRENIERVFYEDIGFTQAWSAFIAVIASFFYALAWVPLSLWTWRVLAWRFTFRQASLAFACWLFVYGHVPLLHAVLGTDACFNQRTGKPQKWYVVRRDGEVQLFDSGGYDPALGEEKRPVTSEICDIFSKQKKGIRSKPVTGELSSIKLVGSQGESRIWYYRGGDGTIDLYDGPGFHPQTRELLLPITKRNEAEVKQSIERMQDDLKKQIAFWIVRDGQLGGCKPAHFGEINYIENIDLTGDGALALLARGSGCYCGGITYCRDWVYGKIDGKFRLLLSSTYTSGIELLETRHNSYRDILARHPLAGRMTAIQYEFDGKTYLAAHCMEASYTGKTLENGSPETNQWRRFSCS